MLFLDAVFVAGRVVRWEGGRLLRWQGGKRWKGSEVTKWESGEVARLEGGGFLVLFKGGGWNSREQMGRLGSRFSCMATGMERLSLDLLGAVKNILGCESVWNW